MIWFWFAAAALAGAAALAVMVFARRAAGGVGVENPSLAVHRRQLSEIDDLAERGLIEERDKVAARAEAGRRLLSAAALAETPESIGSAASRRIALGGALAAGACALILYMTFGAPGLADQPYKARVAAWRNTNPATLDAPRMAAVLKTIAVDHPTDPEVFSFLGKAEMAAGDPFGARKAFAKAADLAPDNPVYQTEMGEARLAGGGDKLSTEDAAAAEAAFRRALALDPKSAPARYALGETRILKGDRAGGVSDWRMLLAGLSPSDPRRAMLAADIDRIAAGGPLQAQAPPPPPQAGGGIGASTFIRAMVVSLAAKLNANPDDPDGWARLVRSYGVLHDAPAQADALARARRQFAARPDALKPIEAEAAAHPAA
jgi:cytochrome c-type biogenesis protein CcmH